MTTFYLVQSDERTEIPSEVVEGVFAMGEQIGHGEMPRDVWGLKAALAYVYHYAVIRGAPKEVETTRGAPHEGQ